MSGKYEQLLEKATKQSKENMHKDVIKLCDKWIDGKITDEQVICDFIKMIFNRG